MHCTSEEKGIIKAIHFEFNSMNIISRTFRQARPTLESLEFEIGKKIT